jgi:peptidoglycan/xylan/chitin deacetylase (PgdA/CDA1 family)
MSLARSFSTLIDGLLHQQVMSDSIAISFDDGDQNSALVAAPALADLNMAAAFFLTSGLIGAIRCIWTSMRPDSEQYFSRRCRP